MPRGKTLKELAEERGVTEEALISDAIGEAHGSIFKAAILLGFYPNTLYVWLKKHPEFKVEREVTAARLVPVTLTPEEDREPIA